MTLEDHFWTMLDADPTDFTTRLVMADWLEEHGDGRAEGFRALAEGRYRPESKPIWNTYWGLASNMHAEHWKRLNNPVIYALLPNDWWDALIGDKELNQEEYWKYWRNARQAENAAALAFARLPADRRAELLLGLKAY